MSTRMKTNVKAAFSRLGSRRTTDGGASNSASLNGKYTAEGLAPLYEAGLTWRETYWRQGPLLGVAALVLAVGCTFTALGVLEASDGQPTANWEPNPVSFYLSISVTACNVFIRFALANGLPILWWRHALQGRMIADLNREWEVGRSLLQAIGSLRSVNLVMLATLSSAILILDGPLMQKASYPALAVPTEPVYFSVRIAPQIPWDWSGKLSRARDAYETYVSSTALDEVYKQSLDGDIMLASTKECPAQCQGTIVAPGLVPGKCKQISFVANSEDVRHWPSLPGQRGDHLLLQAQSQLPGPNAGAWVGGNRSDAESLGYEFSEEREMVILDTAWTNMNDRAGHVTAKRCSLVAASLGYEITVSANDTFIPTSYYALQLNALANNTTPLPLDSFTDQDTAFSAAMKEASPLIESLYYFTGTDIDDFVQATESRGLLGQISILSDVLENFSSFDPTDSVIATMNQVLFRGGLAVAAEPDSTPETLGLDAHCLGPSTTCSLWQTINGTRVDEVSIYKTDLRFWGLAAFVQLLAVALAAPIFWGWWRLGREVSFSPFEIAKAFEAPLLQAAYSNSKAEGIMSTIGFVPVRYGVVQDHAVGTPDAETRPTDKEQETSTRPAMMPRLAFTNALEVASPHHQQHFAI